jgi:ABC-type ATPase with predicted acetyltransferase domain
VSDPCPVGCGRPCSVGREMCLVCWRRVPIMQQRRLNVIVQQMRFEPTNEKHGHAYLLALDQAVNAVTR